MPAIVYGEITSSAPAWISLRSVSSIAARGDHAHLARELTGGKGDEDVLGVGVDAGDHGGGALDPGVQQHLVVGRLPSM